MPFVAVLALGLFFSGPSVDDVNRAARRVLADEDIQTLLPGEEGAIEDTRGRASTERPESSGEYRRDRGQSSDVVRAIMWAVLGVGLLLLLLWVARLVAGYERTEELVEAPDQEVEGGAPDASLPDPWALATAGRYEEAVHALLLHALATLSRKEAVAGSQTSREVLRGLTLGTETRQAAERLVGAVEISLFGGRPLDRAAFESCEEDYERFDAAASGAGA